MQRVAEIAAWAGIHGCHEHKGGGECDGILGTRDVDDAVLKWLAQHLKNGTLELWQFIEEKDAVVCQTDFTRLRICSAAYQSYLRYGMMWRAEGTLGNEGTASL